MNEGKGNPNYKTGIHCEPQYCDCGKKRDYRAKQCSICSGRTLDINDEVFKSLIAGCTSFVQLAEKAGCSRQTAKRRCEDLNLDISHMRAARGRTKPNEEYLCVGTKRINATVKKIVLRDNLVDYVCAICKLEPMWCGRELMLELDHKNGDCCDNRLENLRFLCPNCHTQTPTNKGKNSYKKVMPL